MSLALEAAVASATQLPADEQDTLAALLVAEMDSETMWGELFSASQGALATLAQEALLEHESDQTEPLITQD